MKPASCQGKLIKWKDDRGFGFISSEGENKEIFLHISALTEASRRPKIGDTIFYEKVIGKDGKLSAVKASIFGIPSRSVSKEPHKSAPKNPKSKLPILGSALGLGLVAFGGIVISTNRNFFNFNVATSPKISSAAPLPKTASSTVAKSSVATPKKIVSSPHTKPNVASPQSVASPTVVEPSAVTDCNIKGNISVSSGKKFYHLQGMPEYEITQIDIFKGERYFCTETEAIASGWRKAPR